MNLDKLKQEAREKWDILHRNRTDRPPRMETHYLSDEIIDHIATTITTEIVEQGKKIIGELQYQNSLKKDGAIITNAKNGGYILDKHQQRMDDEFDKAKQEITQAQTIIKDKE